MPLPAAQEDPAGKLRLEQRSQAVPEWAAGAVQIAAWNGMHVALLSSGGNVAIAHAATWEQAAHVPGFPTGAVMAPAMPCNPLWERPLEGGQWSGAGMQQKSLDSLSQNVSQGHAILKRKQRRQSPGLQP
jgi:hypothetical protein